MAIQIIGSFNQDQIYCVGSFTKLLTTFVCLSFLSEKYELSDILDDPKFLDEISHHESKAFLTLFQSIVGSQFTLHDVCTYYAGLPYTFDPSVQELESVDAGHPFKHHSILDEKTFLQRCHQNITPVYHAQSKFHYSELSVIFLGYFIEKTFAVKMEDLYQQYIINLFQLNNSQFSRSIVTNAYTEDLSDKYDYPSIAIQNHGYFCYSNGFYTTLHDQKKLLENLLTNHVFKHMVDLHYARAASNRLLNGLTIEIRLKDDDVIYGYEGLSFSGCNIWAYSTKYQKGYLTFTDDEEGAYPLIYDHFNYHDFDKVPEESQIIYKKFLKQYSFNYSEKNIPIEYQGSYQRVRINDKELKTIFTVGDHFITIRNPDEVTYDVIFMDNTYRIKGKDNVHGAKVGFYQVASGNRYMFFDGNLYIAIAEGKSPQHVTV